MFTRGVGADLPARLALDDRKLHVLDLYPHLRRDGPLKTRGGEWRAGLGSAHQQEEDLAEDDVLEVVLVPVVLELDVQAVLDAHLHLDRLVGLGLVLRQTSESVTTPPARTWGGAAPMCGRCRPIAQDARVCMRKSPGT